MSNNETTEGRAVHCFGQITEDPVAAPWHADGHTVRSSAGVPVADLDPDNGYDPSAVGMISHAPDFAAEVIRLTVNERYLRDKVERTEARNNAARMALLKEIEHEETEAAWATENGYNYSAARHTEQKEKYIKILSAVYGTEEA